MNKPLKKTWKPETKALFLQQLGELLGSGYHLDQSIQMLSWEQPAFVTASLRSIRRQLRSGRELHELLLEHHFPSDITAFVYFAEQSGRLSEGLTAAGDHYMSRLEAWSSFRKVLYYPLFLLWLLIILAYVFVRYLFPQFLELFEQLSMDLPFYTRMVMNMISAAPFVFALVFVLLTGLGAFYTFVVRPKPASARALFWTRLPFLQAFITMRTTASFAEQFGYLLLNGLSLSESCTVLKNQKHSPLIQEEGVRLEQMLAAGTPLPETFRRPWYLESLGQAVQYGQSIGALGQVLVQYSSHTQHKLEADIQRMTMTAQPILFFSVGILILSLFAAVFLPMYHMITSIQ
ncbi:competence type IV pilus assembly protein ComGB [uncultured Marinococcus sp.]|uniref:competence type IV pilus assembly protein ComGB n=1 Tax=uncultured Marinococcus sp. TaxID=487012 RepID=UPI0026237E65|nr:competence type IV pilus assembly protein ComGB [uncultured Marinococcus sp.]